jgi:Sec-independent protein translocase protein TatA
MFGFTRGEIILVVFIFVLVYGAGQLPKLIVRLGGAKPKPRSPEE